MADAKVMASMWPDFWGDLPGQGQPAPNTSLTPYAQNVLTSAYPTGVPTSTSAALAAYDVLQSEYAEYKDNGGTLDYSTWLQRGKPQPTYTEIKAKGTATEAETLTNLEPKTKIINGVTYYSGDGGYTWQPIPASYNQQANQPTVYPNTYGGGDTVYKSDGYEYRYNQYSGYYDLPTGNYDPSKDRSLQQSQQITPYQQQGLQLQQQELSQQEAYYKWQQEEAQKQYESELASNPMSWLQYATYTGKTPVVQPWMMPLSAPDYGWQVGEQIPGWSAKDMTGMNELYRPSAQLWSRMGPTAQAQYYGYQQANLGSSPAETEFRRKSTSAPGGSFTPLRWSGY
jgi:hypothetical protein